MVLAYNMKLPGIYILYALIMGIFGQSIFAIHLGLLIFNSAATVLIFLMTRRLAGDMAAVVAALVYALMSMSPSVLGTSAHATQFLVPFAIGGIFLLLKAIDQRKTWMLITVGLFLGTAFIVKQHAVFFILFAVLYYFYRMKKAALTIKETFIKTTLLIIFSALPFVIVCGWLFLAGVFPAFWFWTFTYSSQYISLISIPDAYKPFMFAFWTIIYPWRLIWIIAGIGLSSVLWNEKSRTHWVFLAGFSAFSFFTICPGFFFRNHYFITLLPAVSMLAGIAVSTSMTFLSQRFSPYLKAVPVLFIIVALAFPSFQHIRFFRADPVTATRMIYSYANPFTESLAVAEYIRNHSSETDTVAVIGSEPQIYFYANRKSATGYIYVYSLMEPQAYALKMQKEMIGEIESAKPRYIVFVNANLSWLVRHNSNRHIIIWAEQYLKEHYLLRGVISNTPNAVLKTNLNPQDFKPIGNNILVVLERNRQGDIHVR
ncbi:MAG: glycosyltransferase family 39 protein [Deltaproteobacteria bacterium]|nr:glycosyltransferase family 39 protein [Deltaproteobacteria bacterium]